MQFEEQAYQEKCVANICEVVRGVDWKAGDYRAIVDGLRRLDDDSVDGGRYPIVDDVARLDVLMETGTGKTFAYLQTILELNRRFGVKKFVVAVPRAAILQGVIQNIRLTSDYFFARYRKRIDFIDYPRDGLAAVRGRFIEGGNLCVLLTTGAAFNSGKNNINKKSESLFRFGSTWAGIAAQHPVVVIDEPHLLKGGQTRLGLDKLDKSLFIRFGATFPDEAGVRLGNVVYALGSVDAFGQGLVKRIGVSTVYAGGGAADLAIVNVRAGQSFEACFNRDGIPQRRRVQKKADLGAVCGLTEYKGWAVSRIRADKISFENRRDLPVKAKYQLEEGEMRLMVREAIARHFAKEEGLFAQGIKALTLFFIPNISDFRGDEARVRRMFDEEYAARRGEALAALARAGGDAGYREYLARDYDADGTLRVRGGYFADSKGSAEVRERADVALILRDKEKLLSFESPLRFVFSVWALQEGWDNPNIFTICKLAPSVGEASRRQQVGRGLRLAVNQEGRRFTLREAGDEAAFYAVNTLDMVVSGKEQSFIYEIQNEINEAGRAYVGRALSLADMTGLGLSNLEAAVVFSVLAAHGVLAGDCGRIVSPIGDFLRGNRGLFGGIGDARFAEIVRMFAHSHREVVRDNNAGGRLVKIRRRGWEAFRELWEAINRKAELVYREVDGELLVAEVSGKFNAEPIAENRATVRRQELVGDGVRELGEVAAGEGGLGGLGGREGGRGERALNFARYYGLPARFAASLFAKLDMGQFARDARRARRVLYDLFQRTLHGRLVSHVTYEFCRTEVTPAYPNALQNKAGECVGAVEAGVLGRFFPDAAEAAAPAHFLFDRVVYDSEVERRSVVGDGARVDECEVVVFAKLPRIKIPTPYKSYSPDFAYLVKRPGRRALFLVVETKGYGALNEVSGAERAQMDYGRKFFERLGEAMPEVEVVYRPRLGGDSLYALLREVVGGGGSCKMDENEG